MCQYHLVKSSRSNTSFPAQSQGLDRVAARANPIDAQSRVRPMQAGTLRQEPGLRDGGVDVTFGCAGGLLRWVFCSERRLSKGAEELFTVNS